MFPTGSQNSAFDSYLAHKVNIKHSSNLNIYKNSAGILAQSGRLINRIKNGIFMSTLSREAFQEEALYQLLTRGWRWVCTLSLILLFIIVATFLGNALRDPTVLLHPALSLYGIQSLCYMTGLIIFRPGSRPFPYWHLLFCVLSLLFSMSWMMSVFHLIHYARLYTSAEVLSELVIMLCLLGFFASVKATSFAIVPMLLLSTYINYLSVHESLQIPLLKLLAMLLIIYTGRQTLMHWFNSSVSKEYDKEQLVKQLNQMVSQDQLTGLNNRRFFEYELEKQFHQCRREQQPLSLIMIDIDYFKPLNDALGHPAGDECLKRVAQVLKTSLKRPTDSVSRFGGEEFIAILPATSADGAKVVSARICKSLADAKILHPASDVSPYVTVSQGIATVGNEQITHQLLQRADSNLYQAKARGRNQACS
ncbi:GGDEF domain-containing protein [Photobacterium ganghwense]|nr:GGDEF domain-containing protein [Photobacterium ganghwense]